MGGRWQFGNVYALKIGGGIDVVDETQPDGRASRLPWMAWAVPAVAAAVRPSLAALTVVHQMFAVRSVADLFMDALIVHMRRKGLIGQGFFADA